jgi:flagellar hook assembly protein FlgD
LDPEQQYQLPLVFELRQNYPNPFNPTTTIAFSLDEPAQTLITIYNLLGQRVTTLIDEFRPAGEHSVIWDGKDEQGKEISSGIYFYLIQSGQHVQAKKMTLLR